MIDTRLLHLLAEHLHSTICLPRSPMSASDQLLDDIAYGPTMAERKPEPKTILQADSGSGGVAAAWPIPSSLISDLWSQMSGRDHPFVLGFYGHGDKCPWNIFSNFFEGAPFSFDLPPGMVPAGVEAAAFPTPIVVGFSEAPIMLCKAALMGDVESYLEIAAARSPPQVKRLGRQVWPWNQERWEQNVCWVAFEVLWQKFNKGGRLPYEKVMPEVEAAPSQQAEWNRVGVPHLAQCLLSTGDKIIAEATQNDKCWGIGCNKGTPEMLVPAMWRGTNVLGWALMQVRKRLREELLLLPAVVTAAGVAAGAGVPQLQPQRTRKTGGNMRRIRRL
mmetsp:Transcript_63954/g.103383  ORF Transcript_63954/g.103383 Transcript_63954/m.103383 type:complete len:332 (+) Transcript_63954:31-1026(+)